MRTSRPSQKLTPVVLIALLLAAGCSRVTSHSLNAEGVRLYQTGNYPQAAAQFQKAIASNPESADGYYNLASAMHQNGKLQNRTEDLQQAEQLYNQALNYSPDYTDCYRGLAVLLVDTGRQDAAYRLLEGWASRSPPPGRSPHRAGPAPGRNRQPNPGLHAAGRGAGDRAAELPGAHGAGASA